jgi:hypothetical protein
MVWMFITMIHQYGWLTTMIIPVGSTLACVGFAWALDATMDGDE